MSMDLIGVGGSCNFNVWSWAHILQLAVAHGWKPTGTVHEAPEWGGNYWSNDGQEVTDADAAAIADAIERALPDVPDHDALAHKRNPDGKSIPFGTPVNAYELFSGERKKQLREFIEFCRRGGFRIY